MRDPELAPALTNTPAAICHAFLHMHCTRLVGRDRAEERKVLASWSASARRAGRAARRLRQVGSTQR